MEKNLETEMETAVIWESWSLGFPKIRDTFTGIL